MAFIAQCLFCNHRVQVPDHALGGSGKCPRCSNYFTLAPASSLPAVKSAGLFRAPAAPAVAPLAGVPTVPPPDRLPSPALTIAHDEVVTCPPAPSEALAPRIDIAGVLGLLVAAAGLLCASAAPLGFLVVPLGLAGLASGGAGLWRVGVRGHWRLAIPIAAMVGAAVLVILALASPASLGPTYLASRQRPSVDPGLIRAAPLDGAGPEVAAPSDGVDASQMALVQGSVRVQVVAVTLGPLRHEGTSGRHKAPGPFLLVRLRVHRAETAEDFAERRWQTPSPREEKDHPVLTDAAGKVYRQLDLLELDQTTSVRRSSIFPVSVADEVFVFEPPMAGVDRLRLELPAAAWGGAGAFRFTIPASMIRREQSKPARR